ncbi:gsl0340 [Gloeobacter violaceus PCC 7421]|uniref:Gsl0340 protein n=1 Tax=Gloeobacter violaceus (strain ATCC 29082 / PCC 7421) TaxID=251221 RepID=Q7NNS0_GLOVI|nr:gsl0340 [Gloeobacter violaceus PCC 7421]
MPWFQKSTFRCGFARGGHLPGRLRWQLEAGLVESILDWLASHGPRYSTHRGEL